MSQNDKNLEQSEFRLNTDVMPSAYFIELSPYFDNVEGKTPFTFDGFVAITIKATKSGVNRITLNMKELNISDISINSKLNGSSKFSSKIEIDKTTYEAKTNKLNLELSGPLDVYQNYELHFTYSGNLRSDMLGFYRSSYKENGETK